MNHHADRESMLAYLRYELVGPWEGWDEGSSRVEPTGEPVDVDRPLVFPTKESAYGPWHQSGSGEEILQRDPPTKRYGIAVLFPQRTQMQPSEELATQTELDMGELVAIVTSGAETQLESLGDRDPAPATEPVTPETDDFELSGANQYRPSSMAISFLVELPLGSRLIVRARYGRYRQKPVEIEGIDRHWWVRSSFELSASVTAGELLSSRRLIVPRQQDVVLSSADAARPEIKVFTRPGVDNCSLVTVSLVNQSVANVGPQDDSCLFQVRFCVEVHTDEGVVHCVLPYPERAASGVSADGEAESFDLLYRRMKTFGVGHGCAADWHGPAEDRVARICAEPFPAVQTPSITPEIFRVAPNGERTEIAVPMGPLAGLEPGDDGFAAVEDVVALYAEWIEQRRRDLSELSDRYLPAARLHLDQCEVALDRMRSGLEFVRTGPARIAFQLANEAVLNQQLRTRRTARSTVLLSDGRFSVRDPLNLQSWRDMRGRGSWRPFQIAFLLATVQSVADPTHPDRETVELIWFPTGGGKTEAYLGLAAFALFYRRLKDPTDSGVEVIMRYTLRLLTQQQFQRASSLLCSMEVIRRREPVGLGTSEFSIGIWLGGDSTPNTRSIAKKVLRELNSDDKFAENKFILLRCPWCSATMGPLDRPEKVGGRRPVGPRVAGYQERNGTVAFSCPDQTCDFVGGLPVYVIDEDIYEHRPSMIVATVDKFAQLAWKTDCRSIFGIGPDGTRISSPPQTIIQDELHLIAGPLGSVVGLYESVIEQLCTDERLPIPSRPKIISSTATIRGYEQQIRSLYAREKVALFPPRGLDASDSFFARFATEPDGSLSPGRLYVGIHGPGLGSTQTAQVRTFSALLQGPMSMPEAARDPWWTLVVFFNSLRELGTSLSLLQSDIPDYLNVIRNRFGLDGKSGVRRIRNPMELTSRLRSDQVPKAIEKLSQPTSGDAVDVCLASSIIEVGIDIDRLSLMTVVGQPKTTSQYIQVTGRVGRQWKERPALIATIYGASKPRDRSHFERFRSYHERLYAQVEPTSVTPFSPPVLDRALHAVLISYVRQNGNSATQPWPFPAALVDKAYSLLAGRVASVDPEETDTLERIFDRRQNQWKLWERRLWESSDSKEFALMRRAGEYASRTAQTVSWAVPTSLRNVDAECRAEVTLRYVQGNQNV
jgi:hypothetical protein